MKKQHKYRGEQFDLDDSKGCYVEAIGRDFVGYVGVNISGSGTTSKPYAWWIVPKGSDLPIEVTPDGLNGSHISVGSRDITFLTALNVLLDSMIQRQRDLDDNRTKFDPKKVCDDLHEGFKSL